MGRLCRVARRRPLRTAPTAFLSHRGLGGIRRPSVVAFAYVVVATASSYAIRLKEPRYVIAIVPMLGLVIGLGVDRGRVGTSLEPAPHRHPLRLAVARGRHRQYA